MNDDSLRKYLKENSTPVPAESLGLFSSLWRKIENKKNHQKRLWKLLPAISACAVLALGLHLYRVDRENRIEEDYLYREWTEMMAEVNTDIDNELITSFEK